MRPIEKTWWGPFAPSGRGLTRKFIECFCWATVARRFSFPGSPFSDKQFLGIRLPSFNVLVYSLSSWNIFHATGNCNPKLSFVTATRVLLILQNPITTPIDGKVFGLSSSSCVLVCTLVYTCTLVYKCTYTVCTQYKLCTLVYIVCTLVYKLTHKTRTKVRKTIPPVILTPRLNHQQKNAHWLKQIKIRAFR